MAGKLDALATALGHRFADAGLLAQALTHPSIGNGRGQRGGARPNFERLEFLGDRVLGLVVADMLFRRFPDEEEGALARRHVALVRREALARIAESIGLGNHIAMSRGEEEAGGRANPGLLADACEAVIGALYADCGLAPAEAFIRRHWQALMEEAAKPPRDAKTALQEWAQARGLPLPSYETLGVEGAAHEPVFLVAVKVQGSEAATGRGPSKRAAEQAAATALLTQMGGEQ